MSEEKKSVTVFNQKLAGKLMMEGFKLQGMRPDKKFSNRNVYFFCHSWIRDIYKRIKCSYIEYWYRARFDFILNDIMAGTLQPERKRKAIKWIFLQDFKSIMFAKKCTIDLSLFFGWLVYWFLKIKI